MKKITIYVIIPVALIAAFVYWTKFRPADPSLGGSPSPTATPDITINWQTHTDEVRNFSLKYPTNWTTTEVKQTSPKNYVITFKSTLSADASMSPVELTVLQGITGRNYAEQITRVNPPNIKNESQSQLGGYGAIEAKIQHTRGSQYIDTVTITENYGSVYALKCHDRLADPCNFEIYNAMVSSFRFTK